MKDFRIMVLLAMAMALAVIAADEHSTLLWLTTTTLLVVVVIELVGRTVVQNLRCYFRGRHLDEWANPLALVKRCTCCGREEDARFPGNAQKAQKT